jgi:Na+-driven multidrug efflux pump
MFVIGIPAGGEFAIIALFITMLYWVLRDFGSAAQATFGLGARILQGLFQPVMSTTFPAAAIAGQNFGAKQFDRVRATFVLTASAVCAIFVALAALCTWQADWMTRLFTSNEDLVALTSEFIRISSWAYVFLGLTFSCSSLFQAMGNTWPVLAINAWRVVAFLIPVLWLKGRAEFKLEHVWYLLLASAALEAAFALSLLRREYRARLVFA